MNTPAYMTMLMTSLAMQLPILLVCLGAGVLTLMRWKEMGRSGIWAVLGFGLGALLCVLVPVVQAFVQTWAIQNGSKAQLAGVFSALSIGWSILRAISYALLFVALLKGREKIQARPSH